MRPGIVASVVPAAVIALAGCGDGSSPPTSVDPVGTPPPTVGAPAPAPGHVGRGTGVFVWFDSAVWGADHESLFPSNTSHPCLKTIGSADYFMPHDTVLSDAQGTGFENLRALVTDDASVVKMPDGAKLNAGNVFTIATSLDPTGTNEFLPWDSLEMNDDGGVPTCFGTVDTAKAITLRAFHSYLKGMLNPATGEAVPVSLMLSTFRTLRWGRILSQAQHEDTKDTAGKIYFGGLTEMGAPSDATNLAPANATDEKNLGGPWSVHWPSNATTSKVDDVDMVLNYTERVIELATYANEQGDLGPDPVVDLYLDLELFQLSAVSPTGSTTSFGTQYPGIENMPGACQAVLKDGAPILPSYWAVPANIADAFWRTLRQVRGKVDMYNASTQPGDVKLTLSVWSQEAYRFLSPRFGIADTTTSPTSYSNGRFDQPFGTAQIKRRNGGTDDDPTYAAPVDWVCDCARIDPTAGTGDHTYQSKTPMADDFTINNCIFQFADRVAYGTYQSVPAALVHPKAKWKGDTFRNNAAVDMVGPSAPAAVDPNLTLPGQGVPLGGPEKTDPIQFAQVATFAPTDEQIDDGYLPDGGWLLYPPGETTWDPYYYNAINAWPPPTGTPTNTPDWSNFKDCDLFVGVYDMPLPGWVPFAARMLTGAAAWADFNESPAPSIILTLELTPLDEEQAGSGGSACLRNSYGNQWVWGQESGTTSCASGETGPHDWPNYLIEPLCQSDRVSYVFGGAPAGTQTEPVTNAWGLAAAASLLSGSTGLSSGLDPQTPWAFNNHFSYHCLLSDGHAELAGFYGKASGDSTGQRACWNPWDYKGCKAPASDD